VDRTDRLNEGVADDAPIANLALSLINLITLPNSSSAKIQHSFTSLLGIRYGGGITIRLDNGRCAALVRKVTS
jgi:hypothetical protein